MTAKSLKVKAWRVLNPDKVRKHKHTYYLKNKEKIKISKDLWRAKNKKRIAVLGKKWKSNNPEKVKASLFKTRYGVSINYFNSLVKIQGGLCAICGEKEPLHTDHCHMTKRIRGLLCQRCNLSIGLMKDSPWRLNQAAKYLLNEL